MYQVEPFHNPGFDCDMCEQPCPESGQFYRTGSDVVLCAECMENLKDIPYHIQEKIEDSLLGNVL